MASETSQIETDYLSILRVDLMYFSAARRCHEQAKSAMPVAEAEAKRLEVLWKKSVEIENRPYPNDREEENSFDYSTEMERISIAIENQGQSVGFAYAPILENIAMTHLLCGACLEAHINQKAEQLLSSREFEDFDRMTITGKWLFLPKILGHAGFDPGNEPFQSFDQLIKWRNKLAHYKELRESWSMRYPVPEFLTKLGLTVPQAEKSHQATRAIVHALARQLNDEVDEGEEALWALDRSWNYFDMTIWTAPLL
jgi:hypothetical protein